MALSPLDSLFDLSPSHLLETEEFAGLERARMMAVDFVEVRLAVPFRWKNSDSTCMPRSLSHALSQTATIL